MKSFSFIDLFSGIGGFRLALEKHNGKCIANSEIDKKALETYHKNFETEKELSLGDITNKLLTIPYADLVVGGVPCQAWSIAGKKQGFDDPRGKLWFDSIKTVKKVKPKVFIFENVKGLKDPRNQDSLELIISELEKLNYAVYHQVLNAKDFGTPQSRERLFIIGIRNDIKINYTFPQSFGKRKKVKDILENTQLKSYKKTYPHQYFIFCDTRNGDTTIHSWDLIKTSNEEKNVCNLILNNRRKSKYGQKDGNPLSLISLQELDESVKKEHLDSLINKKIIKKVGNKYDLVNSKNSSGVNNIYRIYLPNSDHFSTLTATGSKDFVATKNIENNTGDAKKDFIEQILNTKSYRKLSVVESLRLQGFPSDFKTHKNDAVSLKQLGNAVPVPVIEALIKSLIDLKIIS